jgi:SAM-dependent methyltransferase
MMITRIAVLFVLAGALTLAADEKPKFHSFDRQDFVVEEFDAAGYILDIGGGGEGIIGRMKPRQVVAIDLYQRELLESPAGPLKIFMDATDLKFLDASFDTVTAFFSLMYMKPEIQKKVLVEGYRVLKPGGRWLIWDAVIPTTLEKDTQGVVFRFTFKLPNETVQTGYGTFWPDRPLDVAYYTALAQQTGFRVVTAREQSGTFQTFFMELRR